MCPPNQNREDTRVLPYGCSRPLPGAKALPIRLDSTNPFCSGLTTAVIPAKAGIHFYAFCLSSGFPRIGVE